MKYNPEIHHRRSIRLKNHDYSSNGIYFVTICIHEKKALFGNIKNEAVICNSSGEIAKNIWDMIPEKFSGVKIDSFVIMPNHIHGILVFEKQEDSFRTIGDIGRLKSDLIQDVRKTENATRMCNDITMIVALSYGSRGEICRAVNSLIKGGIDRITPDDISSALDTSEIPDPDLLIRTSGEHRISNFLLWQMAYTELYFTDIHWPDFDEVELDKALKSYAKRERRFGMTAEQLPD